MAEETSSHEQVRLEGASSWECAVRLLADGIEARHLPSCVGLEEAVSSELRRRQSERQQAYKEERGLLTASEWQDRHGITGEEWETAHRQGLLPREKVPEAYGGGPTGGGWLYRPELPGEDLRAIRQRTYLSTSKAAAYLGITRGKLGRMKRQGKIAAREPEFAERYPSNFYRMDDLVRLKEQIRPRGFSEKERTLWVSLNVRQRAYLEIAYRRERELEEARSDWIGRDADGGAWRWMSHYGDVPYGGLSGRLAGRGLLDAGTGATYAALRRRGLIKLRSGRGSETENRPGAPDDLDLESLHVRLTRQGRSLARTIDLGDLAAWPARQG